jgi:uncharacterized protein (TIGR02231 family)
MQQLNTSLKAVTVYPDRARVIRQGTLHLEPGLQSLIISELPTQLNPDSLRAVARGTARARLLGVQVQRTFFTETPLEQVRQLEGQIEALQDTLKQLDAQVELTRQNRQVIDKLASHTEMYAAALAAGEMSIEAQLSLLESLGARASQLDDTLQAQAIHRRSLERELQKLTKELEQQRSTRPRERYQAKVEVEVLQEGDLTVELSYVIHGAHWKPFYDLRLVEADGQPTLELGYLAQVGQTTGESWDGVSLSLSTARPAMTRTLPELDPWFIGPPPPPVPLRVAAAGTTAKAPQARLRAMHAEGAPAHLMAAAEIHEAEVVTAAVETSGTAVTYAITVPVTIPPDGTLHKVTVAQFTLSPRLDFVSAPRLVQAAYRRAQITNLSPYTLLPGDANIFVGDEYIGTAPLELTAPQGEIELYLGSDDRLKVERELKRRDVDKRLIGGKRHLAFGYEIKLENLLPYAAKLTVRDQFPVSRHEEIKVRLESAEPRPVESSELNLLRWEFTLGPQEKRTIRFDFVVESPQGMEIIGIPA